jgi:hypothetical protein
MYRFCSGVLYLPLPLVIHRVAATMTEFSLSTTSCSHDKKQNANTWLACI